MAEHKVGYARSTWACVKQFQDGISRLENYYHMPLSVARRYLLYGTMDPQFPPEVYAEVDRLQAIRATGILGEMKYCLAQARKHGITLPESLRRGQDLGFGITGALLDKVPSLGIYTHVLWLSLEELDRWQAGAGDAPPTDTQNSRST